MNRLRVRCAAGARNLKPRGGLFQLWVFYFIIFNRFLISFLIGELRGEPSRMRVWHARALALRYASG